MQELAGQLTLSPTDLTRHLACRHATSLDLSVVRGLRTRPSVDNEQLELIFALGIAHEQEYLESLKATGRSVTEIPTAFDREGRRLAEQRTLAAMHSGVDVIYQGTFFDGMWGGQADFLLRVDTPSTLGSWSYEIADTKLARRLKVPALLQMSVYADRLTELQGVAPDHLYVVTGDKQSHSWRLVDVAAYARRARARLRAFVDDPPATLPQQVDHCGQCRWLTDCARHWRETDDLILVAFMRNDHRVALQEHGITTLRQLGHCSADELPRTISRPSRERLVQQAAEQLKERTTGQPSYTLLPPESRSGLLRLPPPDEGDLYLDFEGDPFAEGGTGREYLAGLGDREGTLEPFWAHDLAEESALTVNLVDRLLDQWRCRPGMHVYHYAPYETTALKRLTNRHGLREAELDSLLRAERFVDLYAVVRQGMRISKESYSIKKMEAFYWSGERSKNEDVADALASVVAYEKWLVTREQKSLDDIAAYNTDDVVSTRDLHDWLEARRHELVAQHGPQLRPNEESLPGAIVSPKDLAEQELAERLRAAAHPLLADLVQWHRREDRPAWWEFFRLGTLLEEELEYDSTALGPLSPPAELRTEKRSTVWRYTFPPQETRVRVGQRIVDVNGQSPAGSVVELDAAAGYVDVKLQKPPTPARGFGPPGPIQSEKLSGSIAAFGERLLSGQGELAGRLLERRVPPDLSRRDGESAQEVVVRVGGELAGEVLAVQGPPGSGKSTCGARLIRQLLDDGKRVGVTAMSHAVIGNLLKRVARPGMQRCNDDDDFCGADGFVRAPSTDSVAAALADGSTRLVGGTAWLWADEGLRDSVDVIVVDEAGQFSLANAVAIAPCATSMVLLGDPQQLAQPSGAEHPPGAGASALEHLLDGHDTIPEGCGIFLDKSFRMHPAITSFVSELSYDGRLTSEPGRERQTVVSTGLVSGSGLRMMPVAHQGNAARSVEEAQQVEHLWHGIVGQVFVDAEGSQHQLAGDHVLIVAPFNSQVGEIRRRLPHARVGTVDKFQGQQAPVVIYSMTSSSSEDAPRGVDFLYDLHRLNVAVSRAQALTVVVCSPTLLDAPVRSPEQLRMVNALCRYAELADVVYPQPSARVGWA